MNIYNVKKPKPYNLDTYNLYNLVTRIQIQPYNIRAK